MCPEDKGETARPDTVGGPCLVRDLLKLAGEVAVMWLIIAAILAIMLNYMEVP